MSSFYTYPQYNHLLGNFKEKYDLYKLITCAPTERPTLINKPERICRFCNLDASKTTFKNEAHTIPFAIGNEKNISDFECDNCNSHFKKYEQALANFLGITRTIYANKTRNGIPTFKANGKTVEARNITLGNAPFAISISPLQENKDAFVVNKLDNTVTIAFKKHPFIPLDVYKCILKIFLCTLPDSDLKKYEWALKFLLTEKLDYVYAPPFFETHIFTCNTPLTNTTPVGIVFIRKDEGINVPEHLFQFQVNNYIIQIIPVFNSNDFKLFQGPVKIPICPPLLPQRPDKELLYKSVKLDFSIKESIVEDSTLTLPIPSNADSEIAKIIMVPQGYITDEDAKEFIKNL